MSFAISDHMSEESLQILHSMSKKGCPEVELGTTVVFATKKKTSNYNMKCLERLPGEGKYYKGKGCKKKRKRIKIYKC